MLKLKPGVTLGSLQPQIAVALMAAERLYERRGTELVVTSGDDGNHSSTSLHYAGAAVDLRVRTLPDPDRDGREIARELSEALGRDYDVLFEGDHIHLEYQPRRP